MPPTYRSHHHGGLRERSRSTKECRSRIYNPTTYSAPLRQTAGIPVRSFSVRGRCPVRKAQRWRSLAPIVAVLIDALPMRIVRDPLKDFPTAVTERQSAIKCRHGRRVGHGTKMWGYYFRANLVCEGSARDPAPTGGGRGCQYITQNTSGRWCRDVCEIVEYMRLTLGGHRNERCDSHRHPSLIRTIVADIGRKPERKSSRQLAIMMELPTSTSERDLNWAVEAAEGPKLVRHA